MRGPFLLRPLHVDMYIPATIGGVYCVGKDSKHVSMVCRDDADLRTAVKSHWKDYQFFWYQPTLSPRECFTSQCYEYHKHMGNGGLDETGHPASPAVDGVKCPVCGE